MTSTFQFRPNETAANSIRRGLVLLSLPTVLLFAGCSNKPEAPDIQKALSAEYGCPVVEVLDVEKLNGEPGQQGGYEVAFAYTVAFKGGQAGAIKLLSDWVYLNQEARAAADARFALERQTSKDDPRVQALASYAEQTDAKLTKLVPCDGKEIKAVVIPLYQEAEKVMKAGSGTASLPLGARLVRTGVLGKTERGWLFRQLALGFNSFEMQASPPAVISLPQSQVPGILSAKAPATAELTLAGVIRKGQTDSCVAVTRAGVEKCYGLPVDATRIFSICGDGDSCSITGQWDDKTESLTAFTRVEKLAP